VRDAIAGAYSNLGDLQSRTGNFSGSAVTYGKLLTLSQELAAETKDEKAAQSGLSLAQTKLGEAYWRMGNNKDALEHLRLALAIDTTRAQASPDNMPVTRKLYITYMLLGQVLRTPTGRQFGSAEEEKGYLEEAANIAERMAAADPNNKTNATDIVVAHMSYGDWLRAEKDGNGAVVQYRKAVDASQRLGGPGPLTAGDADILYQVHQRFACGLTDTGQFEEALRELARAGDYLAVEEKQAPGIAWNKLRRAEFLLARGTVYQDQQRWQEAVADFSQAIGHFEELRKTDPKDETMLIDQPELYARMADCYAGLGQTGDAAQAVQSALERLRQLGEIRALTRDEEDRRSKSLAKLAGWKK
jgi:tetratricopeptide (TPR) repeat protein